MTEIAESDPKSLILVIADMARSDPPMVSPFVAELVRRLQGHGLALALPLTWVEQRLAESSLTIEQMVQSETQQQAADQVSISNTIGSLRFARRDGLARLRRVAESRRAGAARGSRRGVPARWTLRRATATGTSSRGSRSAARSRRSAVAQAAITLARAERRAATAARTIRRTSGYYLIDQGRAAAGDGGRNTAIRSTRARASLDRPVPRVPVPRRDPGDDARIRRRP